MKELLRSTNAYRQISAGARRGELPHTMLALFGDEKYLRALLKECAKAFFLAEEGSRNARLIEEESFTDCVFLPAAGEKLTAELAAKILDESLLRPVEGEKKLFVIDGFHSVTPLVQNKLLKVLEEPAEGVYFLLGATAAHTVLPTVLSRAGKYEAPPFSEEKIEEALARNYPHGQELKRAAAASGGVYSVAESLLAGGGKEFALAMDFLGAEDYASFCRGLEEKTDKRAFFAAVKLLLRDMLFLSLGQEKYAAMTAPNVYELAKKYPAGALVKGVELTGIAERQILFNANFQQAALTLAAGIREERVKWQKLLS